MAQCLHLCTCLAFSSWLQNGWGNSCHLIHVQGRKRGEKERLYQLHLFHFMRKQKLSQKIPPPPADFPHLIRPELTLRATCTWNKDGESVRLSGLYSREQQRWMIFTMASGQLIYSGFCKGTMTRFIYLELRVWEGEEWEIAGETDWGKVAEDSKGLNSTFSPESMQMAQEHFAAFLASVSCFLQLPSLPRWIQNSGVSSRWRREEWLSVPYPAVRTYGW